jgi:peptide/nickel transport system permease protein
MRLALTSVCRIALTVLLGAFLAATLARFAPGFGTDEDQLDLRRSSQSIERLHAQRMKDSSVPGFYAHTLGGYLHGDFGVSRSLNRPVAELIRNRLPPTAIALATGLILAWILGLGAALSGLLGPGRLVALPAQASSGLLQCLPAAVIGLLLATLGGRGPWWAGIAIAFVLVPRVYVYSSNLLNQAYGSTHIVLARAKGLGQTRILLWHAMPVCLPQLLAFAGVSVSLALSAAVPMEVILDIPGIGQLAWQAAIARDMVLLVALSMLLSTVIVTANAAAEWAQQERTL